MRPIFYQSSWLKQGGKFFWSLHDYVFEHQRELNIENLRLRLEGYASELPEFDVKAYASCVEQRGTSAQVERDSAFARGNGINGTPTLFVNGEKVTGFRLEQIRTLIREASHLDRTQDCCAASPAKKNP